MQNTDCILIVPMRSDQPDDVQAKLARLVQFMDLLPHTMTQLCDLVADQLPPEEPFHKTLHELPQAAEMAANDLRIIASVLGGGVMSWNKKPSGSDNEGNA